jgi:TonB family protein
LTAEPVARVLAERSRRYDVAPRLPGVVAATGLHLVAIALALVLPTLRQPPPPPEFVPVQIIPAQALGVERPRQRREGQERRETAPEPPRPAPEPEPEPPAPETDRRPVLPAPEPEPPRQERRKPEPAPTREPARKPPTPSKATTPATGGRETAPPQTGAEIAKGEEAGRRGSAAGNPLGTSAFGSAIAGLEDPNFGYGYYIDRLLQLIDSKWDRPALGSEVRTVLYFRILRSGQIEDLRVAESSGYNSFDLAALRAVQNAAPFPALPASYKPGSLGINLIVR